MIHKKFNGKHLVGLRSCINNIQLASLRQSMQFSHQALFVKKIVFDKIGKFDESFCIQADWDFILRGYSKKYRFHRINKIIVNFSADGISNSKHYIRDNYILQSHRIRKKNKVVSYFDKYMIYDILLLIRRYFYQHLSKDAYNSLETSGFRIVKHIKNG